MARRDEDGRLARVDDVGREAVDLEREGGAGW
jgi:hypothetical protein